MTDDPMDRDELEQAVADVLHDAPAPPMPGQVREQLAAALREAQIRREAGECAQEHNEALIAASLRTDRGTFGPNPIRRKRIADTWLTPRTIGA